MGFRWVVPFKAHGIYRAGPSFYREENEVPRSKVTCLKSCGQELGLRVGLLVPAA